MGEYLAGRLREVAARTPLIGEVRGIGLAIGVEIVRPGTTEPDPATTKEIVEGMRQDGVLIGTTGRHGNTLKIRPPLVFRRQHADQLVATLEDVLERTTASGEKRPPSVRPRSRTTTGCGRARLAERHRARPTNRWGAPGPARS